MNSNRKLVLRLVGAVAVAFCASMALTWLLHDRMTSYEAHRLIEKRAMDAGATSSQVAESIIKQYSDK